jgi:hypothetical protein
LKIADLSKKIKRILNNNRFSPSNNRRDFISEYDALFSHAHKKTMKEISQLRKYLDKKIENTKFDVTSFRLDSVISDELRQKVKLKKIQHNRDFGEFKMPNVKVKKFRSFSRLKKPKNNIPLKLKILNY